jgi:rhodanese-related sulfurtransferase
LQLQSFITQLLYQEIAMSNRITRQQLAEKIRTGSSAIVEALPEKYFIDSHLPGARHLPYDQVELLAPTVLPDRNADIVVYCANVQCQNSHIAARTLTRLGYSSVAVYAEGKQDGHQFFFAPGL